MSDAKKIIVRGATSEDRRALWEWFNEPIRRIAFPNDGVPYEKHCIWFEKILTDDNKILCITVEDTLRIGAARFDRIKDAEYEVYLYIKPAYCGKGYGPQVLKSSIDFLRGVREVKTVVADLRKQGPAYREILRNAGFNPANEGETKLRWELGE